MLQGLNFSWDAGTTSENLLFEKGFLPVVLPVQLFSFLGSYTFIRHCSSSGYPIELQKNFNPWWISAIDGKKRNWCLCHRWRATSTDVTHVDKWQNGNSLWRTSGVPTAQRHSTVLRTASSVLNVSADCWNIGWMILTTFMKLHDNKSSRWSNSVIMNWSVATFINTNSVPDWFITSSKK